MASRTSRAASRDVTLSPSKQQYGVPTSSRSPVTRTTRSTRSQSHDIEDGTNLAQVRTSGRRTRQTNTAEVAHGKDLSVVAEAGEDEGTEVRPPIEHLEPAVPDNAGKRLLPAADITSASGASTDLFSKHTIKSLMAKKQGGIGSSKHAPRTPPAPSARPAPSSAPPMIIPQVEADNDYRPMDYGEDEDVFHAPPYPSTHEEVTKVHKEAMREKNKENIDSEVSGTVPSRSLLQRQPNAVRVQFDSQDELSTDRNGARQRKRSIARSQSLPPSEPSEDEGFEVDRQVPSIQRRLHAPVPASRAPVSSQKKPRIEREVAQAYDEDSDVEFETIRQRQRQEQEQDRFLQASARASVNDVPDEPASTYQQVQSTAKMVTQRRVLPKAQSRVPWSARDCELLLDAISEYGSGWAAIRNNYGPRFERQCEQVALKDKARNMKADYLKSGTPLPEGFDRISLNKPLIEKIRAMGINPYRREGEEMGEESYDMNGDPLYG